VGDGTMDVGTGGSSEMYCEVSWSRSAAWRVEEGTPRALSIYLTHLTAARIQQAPRAATQTCKNKVL
jgi:hypothetical protein